MGVSKDSPYMGTHPGSAPCMGTSKGSPAKPASNSSKSKVAIEAPNHCGSGANLTDAKPQLQVETICTQSANFCQPAIERGFIPSKSIALTQGPCAKRLRQMAKLLRLQPTAWMRFSQTKMVPSCFCCPRHLMISWVCSEASQFAIGLRGGLMNSSLFEWSDHKLPMWHTVFSVPHDIQER